MSYSLIRVPDAAPDAMAIVIRELNMRTGAALRDLQRGLGHALGDGIEAHAVVIRALNLRISTAGNRVMQYTHMCRERPIGRQVVLCHTWDAGEIGVRRIVANGHTMIIIDPMGWTVRRMCATADETTPLVDKLPIHDFGIGTLDYADICASYLRRITYVNKPRTVA